MTGNVFLFMARKSSLTSLHRADQVRIKTLVFEVLSSARIWVPVRSSKGSESEGVLRYKKVSSNYSHTNRFIVYYQRREMKRTWSEQSRTRGK